MSDDRFASSEPQGLLGVLLSPLRAPQRVVTDIEAIASSLLTLQGIIAERLTSVDEHAGELRIGVGRLHDELEALRTPLERIDDQVLSLSALEQAITERMEAIDDDLNKRMLAVEAEVRAIRSPIEQMARDLQTVLKLLPEPGDGPLARLKDTFSPS
ncbi:MAG: hypothetical protein WKF48_12570 [Solirubrobacteraceae bacterium]